MTDPRLSLLWLDRGLVDISHSQGQATPSLPATRQLDPAEALAAPLLDDLLAARGFGALLEAALQPRVADRALLLPSAFRSALVQGRQQLLEAAAADRGAAPVLQRAARVLAEDLALRDLAQMYRGVLHQG